VNFGRIIFQQIYHFHSYLELVRQGVIELGGKVYLNVPSGNFGNALGGYYAMKMGLPVEKILIASNRNNVLTDFIRTGRYDLRNRNVIATSSPAMDILKSSNIERVLFDLFGQNRTRELMAELDEHRAYQLEAAELQKLQAVFAADYADDDDVERYVRETFEQTGYLMDPHTATCLKAHESCRDHRLPGIIYSTAEWTKFSPTIAHALSAGNPGGHDIEALQSVARVSGRTIPPMIKELFQRPVAQATVIDKQDIEREVLAFI
jgi:threonine synthase